MGMQSKQRIGSVRGFFKEFEDQLDFKCNLREVIEVHQGTYKSEPAVLFYEKLYSLTY